METFYAPPRGSRTLVNKKQQNPRESLTADGGGVSGRPSPVGGLGAPLCSVGWQDALPGRASALTRATAAAAAAAADAAVGVGLSGTSGACRGRGLRPGQRSHTH